MFDGPKRMTCLPHQLPLCAEAVAGPLHRRPNLTAAGINLDIVVDGVTTEIVAGGFDTSITPSRL
jgi:hypothetical protein